jgi:uncharacterized RDD family membrane protein YckC
MFCKDCGTELEGDGKFCPNCGLRVDDIPKEVVAETKEAALGDVVDSLKPASQGKRFLNFILDAIFYYLFAFPVGFFLGLIGLNDLMQGMDKTVLGLVVIFIYFLFFEAIMGRSLAKYITKTKVVMSDGSRPDFAHLLGRTASRFIPFDVFSFLHTDPIGWHDRVSGTMVVNAE